MSRTLDSRLKNRRLPNVDAPEVDDQSLRQFLEGVKEHLRMYEGDSGAPKERFVTIEELELAGLVLTKVQGGFASITETPFGPVGVKSGDISAGGSGIRTLRNLDDTSVSGISAGEGIAWSGDAYVPIQLPPFAIEPASQYDLTYRGAEFWENTNGELIWNPDLNYLQLANNHSINWARASGATLELLIFEEEIIASTDPDFASVVLLLKATDPDGTASTTDLSNSAHPISFFGSADNSTDQTKFNVSSFDVRADDDFMTVPDHDDFTFGTQDWTIEFWHYPTASVGGQGLIQKDGDANNRSWEVSSGNGNMAFEYTIDGFTNEFKNLGATGALNAWHYVVIQRTGTDVDYYLDGVRSGGSPFVIGTDSIFGGTSGLFIGSEAIDIGSNAYMDDIRITKGVARYSGPTMTVPTAPPPTPTPIDIFRVGDPVIDTVIDGLTTTIQSAATQIGGTLNVDGAVTALSYGGILEANLLDKTANETITATWWQFQNAQPKILFGDTDSGTDEKNYLFRMQGGQFGLFTATDAAATGIVNAVFTADRTGTVVDVVDFPSAVTALSYDGVLAANLLDKVAAETITGAWTWDIGPVVRAGAGTASIEIHGDTASFIDMSLDGTGGTDFGVRLRYFTDFLSIQGADFKVEQDLDVTGAITAASYDGILAANLLDKTAAETVSGIWTFTAQDGFIIENTQPEMYMRDTDASADEGNWVIRASNATWRIAAATDAAPTVAQSTLLKFTRTGVNAVAEFPVVLTADNVKRGTGTPEAVVTGNVGDIFQRTDGGAGTTLYVKESGTGNTGWVAK